eukprot:m51a1_g11258 hypothetical protein (310) ;mRNA; r:18798-20410
MSLSQINAQYKFGKVTNIFFSDIFSHVFEHIIGIQAMVQQYMTAKKHGHSTMFEQEVLVIHYRFGSNASYLQLDHNHHIISILFIHIMENYNFQLLAISDLYNFALCECSFLSHTRVKKNFITKFMNTMDCIDPSILALINNNLMALTPHPCFHTNLTNLSFLYLSTGCQMTCLKYIFSDNGTDITTNSALTNLIDHWEQHFTEPLSWKELTDKPFKNESPMSNDDFGLLFSGLSDGLWDNISFNTPVLEPSIIKLKNYIMTHMAQQAKKTNKGKPAPNDETSGDKSDADNKSDGDGNGDGNGEAPANA